ncbi:MAG: right-handed parallel beta-helix repeat-containing protein, partial [Limisphaerales bacterium]
NLVIRGYGACLRMNKRDYQKPPYKRAEWRMGVALHGCRHVLIEGLRVESTGGDGFYIDGGGDLGWSEDVTLRDCVAYDNHRQGVSVISAVNLLIENCLFSSTWGTAPEAGIDLEPDTENQRFINCVIRNSVFENNNGHQILIYLRPLTTNSQPVSIRFENCLARMTDQRLAIGELGPTNGIKGVAGIAVGEVKDNGPQGLIEFIHCVSEDTSEESVRIYDKSSASARVRFVDCSFGHPWRSSSSQEHGPHSPVLLDLRHPERAATFGGIDLIRCYVRDDVQRPALWFEKATGDHHLRDVTGTLFVTGPAEGALHLGANPQAISLTAVQAR